MRAARSTATGVPSTSALAVGASAESACVVTTGVTVAPSAMSPKRERSMVTCRSDAAVLRCTIVAPVPSPRIAAVLDTSSIAMRWSPSWMNFVKLRIVLNFEFTCTPHAWARGGVAARVLDAALGLPDRAAGLLVGLAVEVDEDRAPVEVLALRLHVVEVLDGLPEHPRVRLELAQVVLDAAGDAEAVLDVHGVEAVDPVALDLAHPEVGCRPAWRGRARRARPGCRRCARSCGRPWRASRPGSRPSSWRRCRGWSRPWRRGPRRSWWPVRRARRARRR